MFVRRNVRLVAVCAAIGMIASAFVSPASAEDMASISGYVYLDINGNDKLDLGIDVGVINARVTLKRDLDPSLTFDAYTNDSGFYEFKSVHTLGGTGAFTLYDTRYTCKQGPVQVGELYQKSGAPADPRHYGKADSSDPLHESITGIILMPGYAGSRYNFGCRSYPTELCSARIFMDLSAPRVIPVPEPSSVALLLMASGLAAAVIVRRHRR